MKESHMMTIQLEENHKLPPILSETFTVLLLKSLKAINFKHGQRSYYYN